MLSTFLVNNVGQKTPFDKNKQTNNQNHTLTYYAQFFRKPKTKRKFQKEARAKPNK